MINDNDIEWVNSNTTGIALVWVIDGDCLYDLPLSIEHAKMFIKSNNVLDVSSEYPGFNGITVRLMKDDEIINDFQTSEYFGSILLSNPQVLNLNDYPYGRYVQSPHAKFDGEKFIILNQDVTNFMPYRSA
jgi:hypothetical protein